MKIKCRIIGFDLDGTLLNSEKHIAEHTREVLTRAVEQGNLDSAGHRKTTWRTAKRSRRISGSPVCDYSERRKDHGDTDRWMPL